MDVQKQQDASVGTLATAVVAVDLSDKADYSPKIDTVLAQLRAVAPAYAKIYLVHNAGSLGELGYTHEWSSHDMLDEYWQINVHSVLWFNKRCVRVAGARSARLLAWLTDDSRCAAASSKRLARRATSSRAEKLM